MAAIGLVAAVLLYVAAKKFYVYEDPRIAQVEELLPGANCGSCGYNTCREKAIAIYQGKAEIAMCLPYLKEKNIQLLLLSVACLWIMSLFEMYPYYFMLYPLALLYYSHYVYDDADKCLMAE